MPFRGHQGQGPEHLRDPFARFLELDAALEAGRTMLADRNPQRLASVTLLLMPGEPAELASAVRELGKRFTERMSWQTVGVAHPMQLLFAASMLRHGDELDDFIAEFARFRELMRSQRMRRAPAHELLAALVLRIHNRLAPIHEDQVARLKAVHAAMKRNHWWLTGPDDYPLAALLATREGEAEALAARATQVYRLLREASVAVPGDSLQTASNILALADAPAEALAARYVALSEALRSRGFDYGMATYDDVAMLCFLPRPVESVADTTADYRGRIREHLRWYEQVATTALATNLVFVHTVGDDPRLGPLADLKALFDMLWLLASQS